MVATRSMTAAVEATHIPTTEPAQQQSPRADDTLPNEPNHKSLSERAASQLEEGGQCRKPKSRQARKRKPAKTVAKAPVTYATHEPPVVGTPFLDLPPEIRNEIHAAVVTMQPIINVHAVRPFVREPAYLAVSRQIRKEALPLFYGDNTFDVSGSAPCTKFLRSLSDPVLRSMGSIRVSAGSSAQTAGKASLGNHTDKWLAHVSAQIERLHREHRPRGLRKAAIHYRLNVDGRDTWANESELGGILVDEHGRLTRGTKDEHTNPEDLN